MALLWKQSYNNPARTLDLRVLQLKGNQLGNNKKSLRLSLNCVSMKRKRLSLKVLIFLVENIISGGRLNILVFVWVYFADKYPTCINLPFSKNKKFFLKHENKIIPVQVIPFPV